MTNNDQRMVPVELLRPFVALLQAHNDQGDDSRPVFAINNALITLGDLRKLRAIIDGPGVEPVSNAEFCPHCNPCRNSERIAKAEKLNIEYDAALRSVISYLSSGGYSDITDKPFLLIDPLNAEEKLRWGIDDLAAPSAPVPSDDQGPFSKGRLKRLVTQVFGEGWQIVPPEASVQAAPDGWKEAAIAWEVCASIHRQWAKGKDALFSTRQADFVRHADEARAMLAAAPQPPKESME